MTTQTEFKKGSKNHYINDIVVFSKIILINYLEYSIT